ncbi:MAG: hypothetical protein ACOYOK_13605 [Pseudobdellovibrionaceae bacterium]
MKNKLVASFVLATVVSFNTFADIYPKSEEVKKHIKVVQEEKTNGHEMESYYEFSLCTQGQEVCEPLGTRAYSATELKNFAVSTRWKGRGKVAAGTLGAVAAAAVGGLGSAIVLNDVIRVSNSETILNWTLGIAAATGIAKGTALTYKLNPIRNFRQYDALNNPQENREVYFFDYWVSAVKDALAILDQAEVK